MSPDVVALEKWATIFKNPKKLIENISGALIHHRADIEKDF